MYNMYYSTNLTDNNMLHPKPQNVTSCVSLVKSGKVVWNTVDSA